MERSSRIAQLPTIGWREWIAFPDWGLPRVKAKIDTGARSSSLHAFELTSFERGGREYVRFEVHPLQRTAERSQIVEAEVYDRRYVTSSGGHRTLRPVILATIELLGFRWSIELTLANRDTMGFRMLLGRQALRNRFTIDPGGSYLAGKPKRKKKRKKSNTHTKPARRTSERSVDGSARRKKRKSP